MTYHTCRDFLTVATASSPAANMYLISMFLRRVLNYDADEYTGFNIDSATYVKASDSGTFESLGTVSTLSGSAALFFSSSVYAVSTSDVGRILTLKSDDNPTFNSGLFRITGRDTGVNALLFDYRTSTSVVVDYNVNWAVIESETIAASWTSGSNGTSGSYGTFSSSSNAYRLTLSAPGGYHVRLALESPVERNSTIPAGFSIAPGEGSIPNGDFDNASGHLHGPMWFNTTSSAYKGTAVGLCPNNTGLNGTFGQWRLFMAGDDQTGTCAAFIRNVTFSTGSNGWAAWGFAENEPEDSTLGRNSLIERLFVIGSAQILPNLIWKSGYFNDADMLGVAWSQFGYPIPCVMSAYSDIRNIYPHHRQSPSAASDSFGSLTSLFDVELLAGTLDNVVSITDFASGTFKFEPRRIGSVPFARMGRANFPTWSIGTAADGSSASWLHVSDGIFIPWNGPAISGSAATGLSIVDLSQPGETITSSEPNVPGTDPATDVAPVDLGPGHDIDATRYRKTYSYYRQQTQPVGIIKGGSNVPKP